MWVKPEQLANRALDACLCPAHPGAGRFQDPANLTLLAVGNQSCHSTGPQVTFGDSDTTFNGQDEKLPEATLTMTVICHL